MLVKYNLNQTTVDQPPHPASPSKEKGRKCFRTLIETQFWRTEPWAVLSTLESAQDQLPTAFTGARVSNDVTSGEGLSPDKPHWCNCSSKGFGVKEECFAQHLAALVLDTKNTKAQKDIISCPLNLARTYVQTRAEKDSLRLPHLSLAAHPKESRWHVLEILLLLSSEALQNTISLY